MRIAPWEEVAVDLIRPWNIKVNGRLVEFNALTCIDTATNLVELVRIDEKTSQHVTEKFKQTWLARYPKPLMVVTCASNFAIHEAQSKAALVSLKNLIEKPLHCSTV